MLCVFRPALFPTVLTKQPGSVAGVVCPKHVVQEVSQHNFKTRCYRTMMCEFAGAASRCSAGVVRQQHHSSTILLGLPRVTYHKQAPFHGGVSSPTFLQRCCPCCVYYTRIIILYYCCIFKVVLHSAPTTSSNVVQVGLYDNII